MNFVDELRWRGMLHQIMQNHRPYGHEILRNEI